MIHLQIYVCVIQVGTGQGLENSERQSAAK